MRWRGDGIALVNSAVSSVASVWARLCLCLEASTAQIFLRALLVIVISVSAAPLISCTSTSGSSRDDLKVLTPTSLSGLGSDSGQASKELRVFWVNSYQADDPWSMRLRTGVLETLARAGYSIADHTLVFDAFHMDAMHYEDFKDILPIAERAIVEMEAFGPDTVIVSDEEAIHTFIPKISDSELPIVLCGLNGSPQGDYLNRPNVAGVLERPRLLQTIKVAQGFLALGETEPRYLILSDASLSGQVTARVVHSMIYDDAGFTLPPPVDILVDSNWESWQASLETGELDFDFVLLLRYHTIREREEGRYLSPREVMNWLLENSPVPVFGLWDFTISDGAVAGLVISGYDQGIAAADIVVQIARGADIAAIGIYSPLDSLLAMNLAAAREWGLQIPVQFAMAARVYRTLPLDSRELDNYSGLGSLSGLGNYSYYRDTRYLQGGR